MPNKLLGQYFLRNERVAEKIVAAVAPSHGETIFEIGPGRGELTRPLARACTLSGAALVAIEKDRRLAEQLITQTKANAEMGAVEIIEGDALEFFKTRQFAGRPYKIVGNIPYYLTGHLLRIISELPVRPARCVFTLQKEVAERIVAAPPRMNRLAASVQFWANVKIVESVPKESFWPVPKVDSAIITLATIASGEQKEGIAAEQYYRAVKDLFAQPRKTILNNLKESGGELGKEEIASVLKKIGVLPEARPQTLTTDNIIAIARALFP